REFALLLEEVSRHQPLVLVLEDLHWSDQGTVDLLSVLAERPEPARAILVVTYRPAQAAALDHPIEQGVARLRARRLCTEIAPEYLTRRDVAAYLERRFGGAVDEEVASVVHAHSDGNPLFMTLLVDHLLTRGWLAGEGGSGWRLRTSRAAIEEDVPDDLR